MFELLQIKFFSDQQIRLVIKEDEVRITSSKNEFYRKSPDKYWWIKFFSNGQIRLTIRENEDRIASTKNEIYWKKPSRFWRIKFFSDQ